MIFLPLPPQSVQGAENPKAPFCSEVNPVPWHVGHVVGFPDFDPDPWHVPQGASPVSWMGMTVPSTASRKLSAMCVSTSAPRDGCAVREAPPPRLKRPPRISPMPPSPANPDPPWVKNSENPPSVDVRNLSLIHI